VFLEEIYDGLSEVQWQIVAMIDGGVQWVRREKQTLIPRISIITILIALTTLCRFLLLHWCPDVLMVA